MAQAGQDLAGATPGAGSFTISGVGLPSTGGFTAPTSLSFQPILLNATAFAMPGGGTPVGSAGSGWNGPALASFATPPAASPVPPAQGQNSPQLQGFSFTPPPLLLNGAQIAPGLNFTSVSPVAQVDQASEAFNFINSSFLNTFNFVGNAINAAQSNASNVFSGIVPVEQQFGQGEVQALQVQAQALQTAAKNLKSGGGLFGGLF